MCVLRVNASGTLTPQQVHLSLTKDPSQMCVTYVTLNTSDGSDGSDMSVPCVKYGTQSGVYAFQRTGTTQTYTAGGWVGV